MSYLRDSAHSVTFWGQNEKIFHIGGRWIESWPLVELFQDSLFESFSSSVFPKGEFSNSVPHDTEHAALGGILWK